MTATRLNPDKHLNCPTLMDYAQIATTETTRTTKSSRKFGDYDLLCIYYGTSGDIRGQFVIHPAIFAARNVVIPIIHGGSWTTASNYSVTILALKYVSETQFKTSLQGNGAVNCVGIDGIIVS